MRSKLKINSASQVYLSGDLRPIAGSYKSFDLNASHASTAYCKQLPPQQTVDTLGSVWHENTPSKETKRSAQTDRDCQTVRKRTV